jgi:hypothetical protein
VIGIENDYSWTNKQGSAFNIPPFDPTTTSTTREKWIDTLRGRFGYIPWDRVMVYGTGGIAWAGTSVDVSNPAFGLFSESKVRTGWVVGVGGVGRRGALPGLISRSSLSGCTPISTEASISLRRLSSEARRS